MRTQEQMTQELYQAVIGIPENPEDNGLIGDVKDIKGLLVIQNSRISKVERNISRVKGILAGVGVLTSLVGLLFLILNFLLGG